MKLWPRLSPKERDYAELLCEGWHQEEIARQLGISLRRCKTLVREISYKILKHDARRTLSVQIAVALTIDRDPTLEPMGYPGCYSDLVRH